METNNQQRTTNNHQNKVLIRAENGGKKFCRNLKKSLFYGMQDVSYDLLGMDCSHSDLQFSGSQAKLKTQNIAG